MIFYWERQSSGMLVGARENGYRILTVEEPDINTRVADLICQLPSNRKIRISRISKISVYREDHNLCVWFRVRSHHRNLLEGAIGSGACQQEAWRSLEIICMFKMVHDMDMCSERGVQAVTFVA
jgi:hypothetical protein